jgi:hypothetical protein
MQKSTESQDRQSVKDLKENETAWLISANGEVLRSNDKYLLYEYPQYGGEPMYDKSFDVNDTGLNELLRRVKEWT